MPKRGGNISLTSYDDIFETDESRAESQLERVQSIRLSALVPFKEHPFKVVDDEAMLRTTESIAQYGVLTPLIARPLEDGSYEIISGHRRDSQKCRCWFAVWMTMQRQCSWWIPIFRERIFCPAREPMRTR